ncbi:MAG TPA: hypothetical protein VIK41_24360 [Gemmatimonadaceae bacterium]
MSRHNAHVASNGERSAERIEAERVVVGELDAWRARMLPDPSAPLDAEALAQLVVSCLTTLGIDVPDFSVNTVHYYRRKDILDAPAGRTSAARYDLRHVWQAAGARLAGHLGLVTLAEARTMMRGADERALVAFVAARVVDARARVHLRKASASVIHARPLPGVYPAAPAAARAVATDVASLPRGGVPALLIPLAGDAWCVVPASHPAHHSPASAAELVRELASALRVPLEPQPLAVRAGAEA